MYLSFHEYIAINLSGLKLLQPVCIADDIDAIAGEQTTPFSADQLRCNKNHHPVDKFSLQHRSSQLAASFKEQVVKVFPAEFSHSLFQVETCGMALDPYHLNAGSKVWLQFFRCMIGSSDQNGSGRR